MSNEKEDVIGIINHLIYKCGSIANQKGFHVAINSASLDSEFSATVIRLMLIISEAIEAFVTMRDVKPHKDPTKFGHELADIIVRCFDLAQILNIDLGTILIDVIEKNEKREIKHGHKIF